MSGSVPHIKIFISSPGDLTAEQSVALNVIDAVQYDPSFRGKVSIEPVSGDIDTLMLATEDPQTSVNQDLDRPSECDIVIVLFWSRMGTPLSEKYIKPEPYRFKDPGGLADERYLSGTEWEFIDALDTSKRTGLPLVMVYKRDEKVLLDAEDSDFEEKLLQQRRVRAFFDTFKNPDGTIKRGCVAYEQPEEFRQAFDRHLRKMLIKLLKSPDEIKSKIPAEQAKKPLWPGSPFPGLRAFTEADAPIYFGRGPETDALAQKVENERFVAVVGASGSGKSSLVAAGLLPRLKDEQATITRDWYYARFTPGEKPFEALAAALMAAVPTLGTEDPIDYPERLDKLTNSLRQNADRLAKTLQHALKDEAEWVELLLFVDQFEELFTLAPEADRKPFIALLTHPSDRMRVILTMRADFYHRAVPFLEVPLRTGTFTLDKPDQFALLEMIKRPAERAALEFDAGLPEQIVRDTGDEPGALALMAYALDELYEIAQARGDKRLTFADYEALGGVQGAIGQRAESVYSSLDEDAQAMLTDVFRELVAVDENGTPTRKRMPYDVLDGFEAAQRLVDAFTQARLMVQSQGEHGAMVEVAHEALFRHWPKLVEWIDQYKDDLYLLSQLRRTAKEWDERGRPREFLWLGERNREMQAMLERLDPDLNEAEQAFTQDEFEHLLDELKDDSVPHSRRAEIGDRLVVIGDRRFGIGVDDNRIPEIAWCPVDLPELRGDRETADIEIEEPELGNLPVTIPFAMSKYPITHAQMLAFYEAEDGYRQDRWWEGLAKVDKYWDQNRKIANYPAESMNWYTAVAFTRWLGEKLGFEIRLSTEAEWWLAATLNDPQRVYPWGPEWRSVCANTSEGSLGRTTAVGMFPAGEAACGALDMSGNVWEWCLNDYDNLTVKINSSERKALRGGSFSINRVVAACADRNRDPPNLAWNSNGFRVVCAPLSF